MADVGDIRNHDEVIAYLENEVGLDPQQMAQVRDLLARSRADIADPGSPAASDEDDVARNEKLRAINPEWFATVQKRVAEGKVKKRMAEDAKQGRARSRFNRRWPNAAKIGTA